MENYYILTNRGSPPTDLAEFFTGQSGDERTAAVFTSRERARTFAAARRNMPHIQRLDQIGLLSWLIGLFHYGMQRVAVDPEPNMAPHRSPTCSLALLLGELGDALAEGLRGCTAAGDHSESDPLVAYRCENCHKVRRQLAHQHAPVCCGEPMRIMSGLHVLERLALHHR